MTAKILVTWHAWLFIMIVDFIPALEHHDELFGSLGETWTSVCRMMIDRHREGSLMEGS